MEKTNQTYNDNPSSSNNNHNNNNYANNNNNDRYDNAKLTALAEPQPKWDEAKLSWGALWPIHVYGSLVVFMILLLLTVTVLINTIRRWRIRRLRVTLCLSSFLTSFLLCRVVTLVYDPYNHTFQLSAIIYRIFWVIPYPSLTTAFALVLLILADSTRMTLAPPLFQRLSAILIFAVLHFGFVILAEVIVFATASLRILLFLCQILTISFGTLIGIGYVYVGKRLSDNLQSSASVRRVKTEMSTNERRICQLRRDVFLAAIAGFTFALVGMYGAIGVYGVEDHNDSMTVAAWPWLIFQSCARISEIVMCVLIITVAIKTPHFSIPNPWKWGRGLTSTTRGTNSSFRCGSLRGVSTKGSTTVNSPTSVNLSEPVLSHPVAAV